ncbi:MAG TPA: CobD/CbiB family protein [Burkholderiales bacterium]|nr:CobD/CbiB family protein [Burkholderiales bacterium]
MSVIAIIAALVLEQWRPLGDRKLYFAVLADGADRLERAFNAEQGGHGLIAWLVAVLPAVVAAIALQLLLQAASPLLALLFNVAVLYLTLGFRQFSHSFTAIQTALKAGELDRARELIAGWRGEPVLPRTREEVVRLSVEEALLASHRHVFGVLLWYVLLPGPSGAILYRLAVFLCRRWGGLGAFGDFAQRALFVLEWPAVRLTAAAFAVVGDFEDAVYCWRTQARAWPDPNAGVVLAAGAGAMGVRLGMPLAVDDGRPRPELGVGDDADVPALDATVGLLWRALVVWVFFLILLSLGRLLG